MTPKYIIFIYSWIFFLIWIFTNNLINNIFTSLLVLLILVVLFLWYFLLKKKFIKLFIFIILSFVLWILISNNNYSNIQDNEKILTKYYNNIISMNIEIKWVNKITNGKIQYIWKLIKLWDKKIKTNILLLITLDKKINKWTLLNIITKINPIKSFEWFNYKYFMLSKNIYFSADSYKLTILWINEPNIIEKIIIKFRQKFLSSIYEIYPKEEAIFLWWILLWARESLPDNLKKDFNNSWLTHFIAVSWFNITILIIFITFFLQYLPIWLKTIIITLFIAFFTILVGDTAPVIRASIMWLLWYYILISWRKWNILSIIIFTITLMVIYSPLSLNYDISLHLSFLAVLWIIYSQKFFEKIFYFLPNLLEIKTAFTLTLSALIFTLPIMVFSFGQVSILAPFSNIAVTWTIPLAMIFGFISVIVHFVYPLWWIIIGYITRIFLKWDILVVHFFWNLNWALIKLNPWIYKTHYEILYFIILIFIILWFNKKEKQD